MFANSPAYLPPDNTDPHYLRRNWCWFLALGIALVLVGGAAIASPAVATIVTVEVFGVFLLLGGAIELGSAVWARQWSGFFLHLLSGLLYVFLGFVLIERPALGAVGYTLVMAVFFVAAGLVRLVFALTHRFAGRGWTILSGGVTLLLGLLIWRELPEAALWVIGTFVGIDLIFNGVTWMMLALAVRQIPGPGPGEGSETDRLARV